MTDLGAPLPGPPPGDPLTGVARPLLMRRATMVTTMGAVVVLLSALLALYPDPSRFNPMVLLFGILVAAVIVAAAQYRLDGPGSFLWELQQLRQEVNLLRHALETARCGACGGVVPAGSNYCPHCGLRQG